MGNHRFAEITPEMERQLKTFPAMMEALRALTAFCTSGRRYQTQNPYTVPEIKEALKAIAQAKGLPEAAWTDANG